MTQLSMTSHHPTYLLYILGTISGRVFLENKPHWRCSRIKCSINTRTCCWKTSYNWTTFSGVRHILATGTSVSSYTAALWATGGAIWALAGTIPPLLLCKTSLISGDLSNKFRLIIPRTRLSVLTAALHCFAIIYRVAQKKLATIKNHH